MTEPKQPTLIQSFIPIFFLISLLVVNVGIFGSEALGGSNQIVLILSAGVATAVAVRVGYTWTHIQKGIVKSISSAMTSMLILLLIGSLSGSWMLSGIVPAMIYYGLQILNPSIFLAAACVVCAIVSIATGSSWTTSATVGIALIGIGSALGISQGLVAGAILSGAYFGDKMSPLSDTTNLAPAMAGTDLFTHIRYMTITTIPSISIALTIFLSIGLINSSDGVIESKEVIMSSIANTFSISGWLFLVPLLVVILIVKKMPALPALLIGTLLGSVFAIVFQPSLVEEVAQSTSYDGKLFFYFNEISPTSTRIFIGTMQSLFGDISFQTGNVVLDDQELLSSGGMANMLGTIWLIISAMIFGGVMESTGMLKCIATAIIKKVTSIGSLVTSTVGTCIFFNLTASDQYLSIVVPGRMYADTYRKKGLAPENLSRSLEDSGTVTSVLIPWNTCGAYHSTVLGVGTGAFLPYCFFNLISPLMTIFVAYSGLKIKKLDQKEVTEETTTTS